MKLSKAGSRMLAYVQGFGRAFLQEPHVSQAELTVVYFMLAIDRAEAVAKENGEQLTKESWHALAEQAWQKMRGN